VRSGDAIISVVATILKLARAAFREH